MCNNNHIDGTQDKNKVSDTEILEQTIVSSVFSHHAPQVPTPPGWTCHQDVSRTTIQAPCLRRTADWSALSWRPEETLQGHTQSLHEGLWSVSQLMGDTCTELVSMAQCNPQWSSSVRATTHRDCQDQASSPEGPLHQPFSTGPCSAVLPSLCRNFPGSDWPHQPLSNPSSPIGGTINVDGHLSAREDEHHI